MIFPTGARSFLDRGELTFDTSGTLVSPVGESVLKSATIIGNDINVAYAGSTQYNSPFAVLNQSQNGAPEGDLVGVNIGEDGLVVASYSNGSQKSLGKIILANFATPKVCARSVTLVLRRPRSRVRQSWVSQVRPVSEQSARVQQSAPTWT